MIVVVPATMPAVELLPRPAEGRVFREERRVRLGDVDRRGRLRLDAAARLLQDVATRDASDADLDRRRGWLVRRTLVEVGVAPRLGEAVESATWCTGIGRSWAERRSSIEGEHGGRVDAVSLWVQVDTTTGLPARIGDDFTDAYATAAAGRTVSSRLSLPPGPPDDSESAVVEVRPWTVRRSDIDPFGHVNNAANWEFVEHCGRLDERERTGRAEMEYLHPVMFGDDLTVHLWTDGTDGAGGRGGDDGRIDDGAILTAWLRRGEDVLSVARWTPTPGR